MMSATKLSMLPQSCRLKASLNRVDWQGAGQLVEEELLLSYGSLLPSAGLCILAKSVKLLRSFLM